MGRLAAEPPAPPHPGVSPYPPLPSDEFDGGPGSQPGYGSASPYPAYTPYGPDDEIADDALTDYGLPSPQSYGYAPPPPLAEPLPDVGVPEPRFGPSAPSAPPGSSAPQAPAAPPASPAFPDSPAPQSPAGPGPFSPTSPASFPGPAAPSAPQAPGYRENGPDDGDFQDRAYRDRGDDFRGDDFRVDPFRVGEPRAEDTGYRDEPASPGSPGQHPVSSGDTGLRGAPPPTGLPQPGLPQPGTTPSGAVRPGVAPARNPAAAPPLGRPVAPPERSQPGYPPAGPPQGGAQRGPVPGMTRPGGRPPRPGLDDEYDQSPRVIPGPRRRTA